MQYRQLFFDLDHTLWDFESNSKETLEDLYHNNLLINRGVTDFEQFFAHYSFHNHRLWDRYTKGYYRMVFFQELQKDQIFRNPLQGRSEKNLLSGLHISDLLI